MFDDAEAAEAAEKPKQDAIKEIKELEADLDEATDETKARIENRIEKSREHLKTLE